jgi:hypothetical protein
MNSHIVITVSPELFNTFLSLIAEPPINYPRHEREVAAKIIDAADGVIAADNGKRLPE